MPLRQVVMKTAHVQADPNWNTLNHVQGAEEIIQQIINYSVATEETEMACRLEMENLSY